MKRKVKVGVFGGARGETMVRFSALYEEVELVAVCDKFQPALDRCKASVEKLNGMAHPAYYTEFDKFIEHEMDAVVLANYANEHAPYAVRCLDKGLHVISEVLPFQNLAEGVALVEAVERSGKVYAYAENYCYFNATQELRRLYKNGKLGEFLYGEGEYVHDCVPIWPDITYGERDHWRNRAYSTFYCTHSMGPLVHITGLRPVSVVAFETPSTERARAVGAIAGSGGIEMVTMENGGVVKSIHGLGLIRNPESIWYCVYGTEAMAESDRWGDLCARVNLSEEGKPVFTYTPALEVSSETSKAIGGHGGSDFYTMHYFIQKILGRKEGIENSIDVYSACDMFLPGLMGYKSILEGNKRMDIPNLRLKSERDKYRNDTFCTDPKAAGSMLAPINAKENFDLPDSVYENVRNIWKEKNKK